MPPRNPIEIVNMPQYGKDVLNAILNCAYENGSLIKSITKAGNVQFDVDVTLTQIALYNGWDLETPKNQEELAVGLWYSRGKGWLSFDKFPQIDIDDLDRPVEFSITVDGVDVVYAMENTQKAMG